MNVDVPPLHVAHGLLHLHAVGLDLQTPTLIDTLQILEDHPITIEEMTVVE